MGGRIDAAYAIDERQCHSRRGVHRQEERNQLGGLHRRVLRSRPRHVQALHLVARLA